MLGKKKSHVDMGKSHVNMGFFQNAMLGKKSHVVIRKSHVNMGKKIWENLMSTWDFFQNAMLGKKSHVDMGKSHRERESERQGAEAPGRVTACVG